MSAAPLTDADLAAMEERAASLPGDTWGVAGKLSPMLVTDLRGVIQCGDDIDDTCADYGLRLATFPIGYVTDDPAVRTFIAHAREDVPRLLAELRRLRGLLRDYASACDVIDAPQPPDGADALDAALSAHDAARDALYAEGKR